jgi:uncharacterized protein
MEIGVHIKDKIENYINILTIVKFYMDTPQEIEVWYILPALRRQLATEMKLKGLKQKEIAKIMHVTEAAVSQYFKSKRAKEVQFTDYLKNEIKSSSEKLVKDNALFMQELQRLLSLTKKEHLLCRTHKCHCVLPANCEVCMI